MYRRCLRILLVSLFLCPIFAIQASPLICPNTRSGMLYLLQSFKPTQCQQVAPGARAIWVANPAGQAGQTQLLYAKTHDIFTFQQLNWLCQYPTAFTFRGHRVMLLATTPQQFLRFVKTGATSYVTGFLTPNSVSYVGHNNPDVSGVLCAYHNQSMGTVLIVPAGTTVQEPFTCPAQCYPGQACDLVGHCRLATCPTTVCYPGQADCRPAGSTCSYTTCPTDCYPGQACETAIHGSTCTTEKCPTTTCYPGQAGCRPAGSSCAHTTCPADCYPGQTCETAIQGSTCTTATCPTTTCYPGQTDCRPTGSSCPHTTCPTDCYPGQACETTIRGSTCTTTTCPTTTCYPGQADCRPAGSTCQYTPCPTNCYPGQDCDRATQGSTCATATCPTNCYPGQPCATAIRGSTCALATCPTECYPGQACATAIQGSTCALATCPANCYPGHPCETAIHGSTCAAATCPTNCYPGQACDTAIQGSSCALATCPTNCYPGQPCATAIQGSTCALATCPTECYPGQACATAIQGSTCTLATCPTNCYPGQACDTAIQGSSCVLATCPTNCYPGQACDTAIQGSSCALATCPANCYPGQPCATAIQGSTCTTATCPTTTCYPGQTGCRPAGSTCSYTTCPTNCYPGMPCAQNGSTCQTTPCPECYGTHCPTGCTPQTCPTSCSAGQLCATQGCALAAITCPALSAVASSAVGTQFGTYQTVPSTQTAGRDDAQVIRYLTLPSTVARPAGTNKLKLTTQLLEIMAHLHVVIRPDANHFNTTAVNCIAQNGVSRDWLKPGAYYNGSSAALSDSDPVTCQEMTVGNVWYTEPTVSGSVLPITEGLQNAHYNTCTDAAAHGVNDCFDIFPLQDIFVITSPSTTGAPTFFTSIAQLSSNSIVLQRASSEIHALTRHLHPTWSTESYYQLAQDWVKNRTVLGLAHAYNLGADRSRQTPTVSYTNNQCTYFTQGDASVIGEYVQHP